MIRVKYGEITFNLLDRWSEISLDKFIELADVDIPEKLIQLYTLSAKIAQASKQELSLLSSQWDELNKAITYEDNIKIFPEYYGKVISLMSDASDEVIDTIEPEAREELYESVLKGFVLSILFVNPVDVVNGKIKPYNPPSVSNFELDGEVYHFPESINIFGKEVRFANEQILSFAEACDIDIANNGLKNEGIKKMGMFMAVYCRKKGEKYKENITLQRKDLFNKVSMDIVWALFFCIDRYTRTYMECSLSSLLQAKAKRQMELTSA